MNDKIRVVIVRNPFQPDENREVHLLAPDEYKTLQDCISAYEAIYAGSDGFRVTVNSYVVEDFSSAVKAGDFIVMSPVVGKGGKSVLGLIAAVALSVVSFGVGGLAAGGSFWGGLAAASGWAAVGGYLAAAAVMFLGGSLVSKMFAGKVDVGKYNTEGSEATYSWNGIQTMEGQNNPEQLTYGKVKSGGQSIAKFVDNDNNDQYLNWLIAAGSGPLEITEVKLNDNDIGNYEGVKLDIRPGINDQAIIDNFNDIRSTKSLGYELEGEWRQDVVTGSATQGIIIDIEFSQGLYHADDDGNLVNAWVDLAADYALRGSDEWKPIVSGYTLITSNPVNAVLIDDSAELGNWKIRVNRVKSETTDSDGDTIKQIYWRISVGKPSAKDVWIFAGISGTFGWYSDSFSPGETGSINVGPFRFDKQTMQDKGDGYSTNIGVSKNGRVTAAQSSAVRRSFRIDNIAPGEYDVRVRVVGRSASTTSTRDGVKCWWTMVEGIVYDDFIYPDMALIGIKALATSQLNGTPTLTFMKERANVWVWNPYAKAYEEKPANNPAWAAYDFIHQASQLTNIHTGELEFEVRGAKAELMMYDKFAEWAEFCTEYKLEINIEINTTGRLLNMVNEKIAPIGRGLVLCFGTKFGCIWNGPKQPTQMFGMGNIIQGTFEENFMQLSDRVNALEITFTNKQKNYERDTLVVYGKSYDDPDAYDNTTQVSFDGITSYEQAYREGKFQLYCNQYLTRTYRWKADIDAIACTVGDLVYISHDVTKYGTSGRIIEVEGPNITCGAFMEDYDPGKVYRLQYRSSETDNIYKINILQITVNPDDTQLVVDLQSVAEPPAIGDIFDIAEESIGTVPVIIQSINRDGDLRRQIEAIIYNENVYSENYNIPEIDYSTAERDVAVNVINLQGNQVLYCDPMKTRHSRMFLSWRLPDGATATKFSVQLSSNGGTTWTVAGDTTSTSFETETTPGLDYLVKVVTVLGLSTSTGTVISILAATVDLLPPNVLLIDHDQLNDGTRRFWWNYNYPNPNDVAGFKLKYIQGSYPTWEKATDLHTGLVTLQPFETKALRQGVHTVMIKAVDNAGQESYMPTYAILNLGDLLEENVLYKVDITADNWSQTVHDGVIRQDGQLHALQNVYYWQNTNAQAWTAPTLAAWQERYSSFNFIYQALAPASGQFWLQYEIDGPAAIEHRKVGDKPVWSIPEASAWEKPQYPAWLDDTTIYKPYTGKVLVRAGDTIQVRASAQENVAEETVIKTMDMFIDVPDREEHFENLNVPEDGVTLDIKTPHYYTTAVRIDAVQDSTAGAVIIRTAIISRNPCRIKLLDINNNPVAGVVDVTWQGFEKELI